MQIPVLQKGCVMFITMTNEIKEKVRNKTFLTLHTKLVDSFFVPTFPQMSLFRFHYKVH